MKHFLKLLLFVLAVPSCAHADARAGARVRTLYLKRDDIALIRTAVGIATIIQVPDHPTSVVLGDLAAFKVEYLDTAITIKPLAHNSKSNLYIYTESRRFNVSLVTLPQMDADYIVYLKPDNKQENPPRERWRNVILHRSVGALTLRVYRLGVIGDRIALDYSLSSKKEMSFGPDWIWVTQNKTTIPIQALTLSSLKLAPGSDIKGQIEIRREDVAGADSLVLEVRTLSPVSVKLPGVAAWMK